MLVAEQTGRLPKELENLVELPPSCYEVWSWFGKLHAKRTTGSFSVNPIQYSDMKSFFDLYGIEPQLWEISLIEKLDELILKQYSENNEQEKAKSKAKAVKPR